MAHQFYLWAEADTVEDIITAINDLAAEVTIPRETLQAYVDAWCEPDARDDLYFRLVHTSSGSHIQVRHTTDTCSHTSLKVVLEGCGSSYVEEEC